MIIKQRSGSAWPGLRVQGGIAGIECGKLCGGGLHVPNSILALWFCERARESLIPIVHTVGPREALSTNLPATYRASWPRQAIAVFNASWALWAISDVYWELGKSHPVEWLYPFITHADCNSHFCRSGRALVSNPAVFDTVSGLYYLKHSLLRLQVTGSYHRGHNKPTTNLGGLSVAPCNISPASFRQITRQTGDDERFAEHEEPWARC